MPTSETVTRGVRVRAESRYHPERSRPEDGHWFFSYTIRIANEGPQTVQLVTRKWTITNANGQAEEVHGPGVVGEQPRLEPGQSFEYTSFCPLKTPFGSMRGYYQMTTDDGETFDAAIAEFELSEPLQEN